MTYAIDERRPPYPTIELLTPNSAATDIWGEFIAELNRQIVASFGGTQHAAKSFDEVHERIKAYYRRRPCQIVKRMRHLPREKGVGFRFRYAWVEYGGDASALYLFTDDFEWRHWRRHPFKYVNVKQEGFITWKRLPTTVQTGQSSL